MKIVIISDWFAEKMGYAENSLPKALAALKHEVHLITSNVQPYFSSETYQETYEPFIGPEVVACEVKEFDGYTLHRLPYSNWLGPLRIKGLWQQLLEIRPDIVQTFHPVCPSTYEAALARPFSGYKLFLEAHVHASVFSTYISRRTLKRRLARPVYWSTGRLVSYLSEKCYPISLDAAEIAVKYFGIQPEKIDICSLGVDTDLFRPVADETSRQIRSQLRPQLGFSESDIICIYTGRFSEDKNPLCLAQAVASLVAQGQPFRGLFVGSGPQEEKIRACPGCVIHSFVPVQELPSFYWAADIGVWPTQESTSQLDAAAAGLPIILSDRITVLERVEGNGLVYQENAPQDLARVLLKLSDPTIRAQMGEWGVKKMVTSYSWNRIASQRVQDYETALKSSR